MTKLLDLLLAGISKADVNKWRYAIAQLNTDPFGKPREAGKSVTEVQSEALMTFALAFVCVFHRC